MKAKLYFLSIFTICSVPPITALGQTPLGTSFTYQGQVRQDNLPLDGAADFQFRLYPALAGGTQVGTTLAKNGVQIKNGLFSVELDFGTSAFTGDKRFIELSVRSPAGSGSFTTLTPRQAINGTPFALFALSGPGGGNDGHSLDAADGSPTDALFINNSGNVGIGTSSPEAKFVVAGGEVRLPGGANPSNYFTHFNYSIDGRNYIRGETILADTGGNVGIGTSSPSSKVEIAAQDALKINGFQPFITMKDTNAGGARSLIQAADGGFNFYTESSLLAGNFNPPLVVQNDGLTVVHVLQINGGSDLAEPFEIADVAEGREEKGECVGIESGMVVVIDADRPGGLRVASSAYDTKVAGVISGAGGVNTGMVMGQKGSIADGDHPVALTGRVYVWCDASTGTIEPGALLTTSDTPGHAMKAEDRARSHGAVIGKAMTSLSAGEKGLVLVLVNLQ